MNILASVYYNYFHGNLETFQSQIKDSKYSLQKKKSYKACKIQRKTVQRRNLSLAFIMLILLQIEWFYKMQDTLSDQIVIAKLIRLESSSATKRHIDQLHGEIYLSNGLLNMPANKSKYR